MGRNYPLDVAAHIVGSTAEGLHQAHELCDPNGQHLGVVHRDVSPGNIMIGYDGTVRVMDFGIAKAADRLGRTEPGMQKGKAPYMAPEQICEGPLDRRVDIFALGIVLWEATVGKRLFKASNDLATISRIMNAQVPKPSAMRKGYPAELERIVLRALKPNPEERYPTARAMAQELRGFLESEFRVLTAVDLESFMRETFPDRHATRVSMLSHATSLEPPTTVHRTDEPHSLSGVPSDAARSFTEQLDALIEEELADRGLEATLAATPPSQSLVARKGLTVSGSRIAMLALVLIALGLIVGSKVGEELQVRPVAPPAPAAAAPPVEAEPTPRVMISFNVAPKEATIEVDGKPHSGSLVVDRSEKTYQIAIAAPDHRSIVLNVVGDRDRHLEVALEKQPAPPPRAVRMVRKKKTDRPPDGLVDGPEL